MKQEIKRYLVSSLITFLATFVFFLGSSLNDLNWELTGVSALLAVSLSALRVALKMAWEVLIPLFAKLIAYAKSKLSN